MEGLMRSYFEVIFYRLLVTAGLFLAWTICSILTGN